jgi:hypothetical protein
VALTEAMLCLLPMGWYRTAAVAFGDARRDACRTDKPNPGLDAEMLPSTCVDPHPYANPPYPRCLFTVTSFRAKHRFEQGADL